MATVQDSSQQDAAAGNYYGAPVVQPYMPGSGYLEPQHQGIDIGLPATAVVTLPQTGTYQEALSSPYLSVFKMANGLYEDFLHLVGFKFSDQQVVPAGSAIGYLDQNVYSPGGSGYYVTDYGGTSTGPFFSTAPHLHVAEYSNPQDAAQAYGSSVLDPIGLFTGATPNPPATGTPTPSNPTQPPSAQPAPTPTNPNQPPASSGQTTQPNTSLWGSDVTIFGQDTGINLKKIGVQAGAFVLAIILIAVGAVILKQS